MGAIGPYLGLAAALPPLARRPTRRTRGFPSQGVTSPQPHCFADIGFGCSRIRRRFGLRPLFFRYRFPHCAEFGHFR